MRPLKPKKSIEGVSRAKMYIKRDLEFLVGYPGPDGRWVSQPESMESETMSITREHIHKATFTINKLVKDFPKVLPKIVGDVDKWSERHKYLLEILKVSVHQEKPLNESLVGLYPEFGEVEKKLCKKLIRENPDLSYVVNSFSWITCLEPETFKDALIWMDNNAEYICKTCGNLGSSEGLKIIVNLWRISNRIGIKRAKAILLWISDTRIYGIIMDQGYNYASQAYAALGRKKSDPVPNPPEARFGKDILRWIEWLSMQDEQTAKRSLELFELVCDRSFLDKWEHWWKLLNIKLNEARKIPRPIAKSNPLHRKLEMLREKINRFGENSPPPIKSKMLFNLLKEWSEKEKLNQYKQIYKALGILPCEYDNVPLRMAFWFYWAYLFDANYYSKSRVNEIIIEFAKFIDEHDDFSMAINPWREVLDSWKKGGDSNEYIYTIDDEILDEIKDKKDIRSVFDVLRGLYCNNSIEGLERYEKGNLVLLVDLVKKEHALNIFYELRKCGISSEYIRRNLLNLAIEIAGQNHEYLGSILKALLAGEEKYNDLRKVMKPILVTCNTDEYGMFLIDAVIGGQLKALCEIALKAGIIENLGEKALKLPMPLENNKEWLLRYPEELHKDLLWLASSDENAKATAERILSNNFPTPESLEKELDKLLAKIENGEDIQGFLKTRVENLKNRIEEHRSNKTKNYGLSGLSVQKLKNLSKKLRHAAMIKILNRWNEEIDTLFRIYFVRKINTDEFPEWLERNNILEILLSTGELSPTFQNIVHTILKRRAGALPWDLRDEADNQVFIKRLEAGNINMEPWLDGDDTIIETIKSGEEIIFSIERDPIEIFSMGLYFQTCLSPGGINFFSVFSNIIDINKQVVYGKTRNGIVKARALIALTDKGGILTFHPYCNDPNLDFKRVLKEFVYLLAKKMNTVVLPTGNVSKLIAPDWYDDGPYNLTEKFRFTFEGEDFRSKISELDSDELLQKMKKSVEPLELNEITIPLFIFLPEFKECSKLIDILFPYVLKLDNLPSDAFFTYVQALVYNEKSEMLKRLAPKFADHMVNMYNYYDYWSIKHWIELLIPISPSKALEVLKKTRRKGIRSWEEDDDGDRITAVGKAYLKLNRPAQASRLFSIAVEKYIGQEAREFCIEQLKEMNTCFNDCEV